MGMADELRNQQAQQEAFAARGLAKELEQARIFAESMDRLAPEYAQAAREVGIKPEKAEHTGMFAKRGWEVRFKRENILPKSIGTDIPEDDPSRRVAPKKRRGFVPSLYVFTDGSWAFVIVQGGIMPRPERMSSAHDHSYDSMREQLMRDLTIRVER